MVWLTCCIWEDKDEDNYTIPVLSVLISFVHPSFVENYWNSQTAIILTSHVVTLPSLMNSCRSTVLEHDSKPIWNLEDVCRIFARQCFWIFKVVGEDMIVFVKYFINAWCWIEISICTQYYTNIHVYIFIRTQMHE